MLKTISVILKLVLFFAATFSAAQEESIKPGINEKFLDPALKVEEWLKRFEVESREVFHAKETVVEACGIRPGMRVADIGAGTGLYTRLFSKDVGAEGWVYAVDINPRFLEHIQARAKQEDQSNITTVLSPQDSVGLPPASLDLVFICDTYHHFEYPRQTLASIVAAMKPGAELILIDFERIEGVTSDWIMGHVRAGKEVFRQEVLDAGLVLIDEVEIEGLKENYFLKFRKKPE
ncbi:MAG: putative methyltransferase [Verrucomicrobiales bacterium]|jgi:predicted methyltransferase